MPLWYLGDLISMLKQYDYDAIIIGAGISGLVCGCYLAKAGMKVLIVEKNAKPGGYCTSFKRGGFQFDACAHSLGSFRKGGNIEKILRELDLKEKINIVRYDPSDIITGPDCQIAFWNNLNKTINELQVKFRRESDNIRHFFNFLNECSGISFAPLRRITFNHLLEKYFKNIQLKAFLSLPILGNTGYSVSKVSAFTAVTVYKEFVLDGGYYPEGGMQELPDLLLRRLKELGGDGLLSTVVEKIKMVNSIAEGIILSNKKFISAKYVISNVDARLTFLDLLGEEHIPKGFLKILDKMIPSLSMFILYLGIDKDFDELPKGCSNMWFLPHYDLENMFLNAIDGHVDSLDWFLLRTSNDRKSILRFVNCPYKDKKYWKSNKKRLIDLFIKKSETLVPNFSKHIVFKDAATPNTLNKWTLNYQGAAYGWASLPSQIMIEAFTRKRPIHNLYLTSHWSTLFQGIPGVAFLGRETAKKILSNLSK
jgi:prolycopene isomerase